MDQTTCSRFLFCRVFERKTESTFPKNALSRALARSHGAPGMQRRTVLIKPHARALNIDVEAAKRVPVRRRMIKVNEMGAFVSRDVIENPTRRKDEPPGKRQASAAGA